MIDQARNDGKSEKSDRKVFNDAFAVDKKIEEAGEMDRSLDPHWWLNSGAYFIQEGGLGGTIQGEVSENSVWFERYGRAKPGPTDGGLHPQNIFRLVTRSQWQNYSQQVYFRVVSDNLSDNSSQNASNGLLLFNRYQDGDNLYYTGIRVDGAAVIKKKQGGTYSTLALADYFSDPVLYDRLANPNLLPKNVWIGVRSQVTTEPEGVVNIKLFLDLERTGQWDLVLEAEDRDQQFGIGPILEAGFAGIRTDFMDVEFDDYEISET